MKTRHTCSLARFAAIPLLGLWVVGGAVGCSSKAPPRGPRTVDQVLEATRDNAADRFPDLADLTSGEPIALLAFKDERRLELWKQREGRWTFVQSYDFTAFSGTLGPKLKEGDKQIPEGLYRVEYLNPNSEYHLSLKIDYPNAFDRARAAEDGRTNLGGDIFLHGEAVTIGCIPIGNDAIEEVFHVIAANGYTNTLIVIAPYDMRRSPHRTLAIDGISWEEALYQDIADALVAFRLTNSPSAK